MGEAVAVLGMTVVIDSPTVTGVVVALPPTGTKVRAEGALVHRDGDQITVSAIIDSSAGATIPDPLPYVVALEATATTTKAEGTLVLREGDISATVNANPLIPGSPPVQYPVSFECKIDVAGQTKVVVE